MATKTAKLPWMKFFPGDWSKDPALTLCAPATRGVWIDLICAMHDLDQCGELRGTADQLARFARCSTVEFVQAMTDIQTNRAADVTERNGVYSICNRRMRAAYKTRKSVANRVKRHRERRRNGECNADDTPQRLEVRGQNTNPPPPTGFQPERAGVDGWAAVEKKLLSFGLGKASECVRAVIAAGCNPQQVLNLIEFWRGQQPAWGVGALAERLKNFRPDQSLLELWPPKTEAAVRDERRVQSNADRAKQAERDAAEKRERQETKARDEARLAQLEADHGATLDAMPLRDVRKLLEAMPGGAFLVDQLPKQRPIPPGATRRQLLGHLAGV